MKYLNLTKGFTPFSGDSIDFEVMTFSGGEPHIQLTSPELRSVGHWTITQRINSFNDLGILAIAVDALKRYVKPLSIDLYIPYFPGARQDRVANEGEALTVKVYADMINAMGFDEVKIFDPHSDVTAALINNCKVITNHEFVKAVHVHHLGDIPWYLISPDAGANKKIHELAGFLSMPSGQIIKCDKRRDTSTGKLSGFSVYSHDLDGASCVIVDDICDGGGTFVGLAKELKRKGAGDLYLIVSHGIFSRGLLELKDHFKGIYSTDSWMDQDYINDYDCLKQIKLADL